MNKQTGFTLIEAMITFAIITTVAAIFAGPFINPPAKTEAKAYEAAARFIEQNKIAVKRQTCGHDSDHDGQSSCTIVTADGERIFLSCPVGIWNTSMGAVSCKEISEFNQGNVTIRRR